MRHLAKDGMNKELIFKKLEGITNLPTLPAIMQKLTKAVRDPKADTAMIAAIIKDDPSMMARILRVVNSAVYGMPEPVTSLQQALAIMGMNALNNIALSTAVFSTCSKCGGGGFNLEEFWRHCISVGIAANILNERTKGTVKKRFSKDTLHLCGLLHDIGKIIFEEFFREEFMETLRRSAERQIPLFQAELEVYGTNHAEIGAWLGTRWNLTPDVIQAIRWHHEPENAEVEHVELLRLCHAANHICNIENLGFSGDAAPSLVLGVWKRIGLGVKDIADIVERTQKEAEQSETLMSIMFDKQSGRGK